MLAFLLHIEIFLLPDLLQNPQVDHLCLDKTWATELWWGLQQNRSTSFDCVQIQWNAEMSVDFLSFCLIHYNKIAHDMSLTYYNIIYSVSFLLTILQRRKEPVRKQKRNQQTPTVLLRITKQVQQKYQKSIRVECITVTVHCQRQHISLFNMWSL